MTGGGEGHLVKHACFRYKGQKKFFDDFYTRILLTLFYPAYNCKWGIRLILQQQIFPMNLTVLMFQLCFI